MDISILETYIGRESDQIYDFISRFRARLMTSFLELNAACADGNTGFVCDRTHRLKSSASYAGALKISSICAEMEIAGNAENILALKHLLPIFKIECDAEIQLLDQWLAENKQ
jgi:HPt (histidine-containing phosphotransfer) domain-containing protein